MDQPTETIDPENPHIDCWSGWRVGSPRRCLAECPVGPMLHVVRHLANSAICRCRRPRSSIRSSSARPTVPPHRLARRSLAVPALASAGSGCLGGEDRSEGVGEGGVPVAHQELNCSMRSARSMRRVRACWATGSPVGLAVTPRMWTRRVETSSTNRTYRRLSKMVSAGRSRRPRSLGLGGQELLPGQAGAAWCRVDAASFEEQPHCARCEGCPSGASSPWMRRELHVGFSAAIGRIRRRSSGTVEGRDRAGGAGTSSGG